MIPVILVCSFFSVRICYAIYVIVLVWIEMFVYRYFVCWVEFDEPLIFKLLFFQILHSCQTVEKTWMVVQTVSGLPAHDEICQTVSGGLPVWLSFVFSYLLFLLYLFYKWIENHIFKLNKSLGSLQVFYCCCCFVLSALRSEKKCLWCCLKKKIIFIQFCW